MLEGHDLARFRMGFHSELVGVIRVFERSLRVPGRRFMVALFIVLGSGSVGSRGELMLLSRFAVCIVHIFSFCKSLTYACTTRTTISRSGETAA